MAFDLSSAVPIDQGDTGGRFDISSAVPVKDSPKGNDAGEWGAGFEGLANSVPAGQKITSAIGAGIAKAASPITGDDRSFGALYNQANADTEATAKANPKSAMAGSATGIVSSLPIFGAAVKAIGAGADAVLGEKTAGALSDLGTPAKGAGYLSRSANLGIRAAKGAAGAAPVGALYGAANDTTGHTLDAAESGAGTAAALGAGLPVAAAGLGVAADALGPASRAVKGVFAPAAAAADEASTAMGKVVKRFTADFPDVAQRQAALDAYIKNPDIGLAEAAGKNTKNLALGAAQHPSGDVAANEYFGSRIGPAPARIAKTFADQVSSNQDYFGTLDSITKNGRMKAGPLYDKAFDSGPVISDRVTQFLQQPELNTGIARGMKIQRLESIADGKLFNPLDYGITKFNEAGDPIISGVPNMRLLDAGKRGLDAMIHDETDATTGKVSDMGRALVKFKNSYLGELDKINPDYAAARDAAGDYLRNGKAMADGRNFMSASKEGAPEQIAAKFKSLGPTEQDSYKAGMIRAVGDKIDLIAKTGPDNAALGNNIYRKVFGDTDMQNRFKAVLNPSEFNVLSQKMQGEANLYEFRNKTISGSPTALKQISGQEFNPDGADFWQDVINQGPKAAAWKKGAKFVSGMFDGISDRTAAQVSKILYETDPAKKLEILKNIQKNAQLSPDEKQTAVKAYFSVDKLFKNLSKTQTGVNNGEENE